MSTKPGSRPIADAGDRSRNGAGDAEELATVGRICFPINSSAISDLCYTVEQTLTITFTDGSQYGIPNFPVLERGGSC
jgi:hypothetical protein